MPSRTVSLEASAYERLKSAKAPRESFSDTINRILSDSKPSFRVLSGFLSASDAKRVKRAVRRMRSAEASAEKDRLARWK